jgi:HSP20 family protein
MKSLALFNPNSNSIIEDWFNDMFSGNRMQVRGTSRISTDQDNEHYYIKATVPGFKQEDIDISLRENIITISGTRTKETRSKRDELFTSEQESFSNSYTLPKDVNANDIMAEYKNGILLISVPRVTIDQKQLEAKKIEINNTG